MSSRRHSRHHHHGSRQHHSRHRHHRHKQQYPPGAPSVSTASMSEFDSATDITNTDLESVSCCDTEDTLRWVGVCLCVCVCVCVWVCVWVCGCEQNTYMYRRVSSAPHLLYSIITSLYHTPSYHWRTLITREFP